MKFVPEASIDTISDKPFFTNDYLVYWYILISLKLDVLTQAFSYMFSWDIFAKFKLIIRYFVLLILPHVFVANAFCFVAHALCYISTKLSTLYGVCYEKYYFALTTTTW